MFTTDNCVQYIEISARIDSIGIELKNLSVFKRKERNLLSEQLSTKRDELNKIRKKMDKYNAPIEKEINELKEKIIQIEEQLNSNH